MKSRSSTNLLPEFQFPRKRTVCSEWNILQSQSAFEEKEPQTSGTRRVPANKQTRKYLHHRHQTEEIKHVHTEEGFRYSKKNPSPLSLSTRGCVESKLKAHVSQSFKMDPNQRNYKSAVVNGRANPVFVSFENNMDENIDIYFSKYLSTKISQCLLKSNSSYQKQAIGSSGSTKGRGQDNMQFSFSKLENNENLDNSIYEKLFQVYAGDHIDAVEIAILFTNSELSFACQLWTVDLNGKAKMKKILPAGESYLTKSLSTQVWFIYCPEIQKTMCFRMGKDASSCSKERFSFVFDPVALSLSFMVQPKTCKSVELISIIEKEPALSGESSTSQILPNVLISIIPKMIFQ